MSTIDVTVDELRAKAQQRVQFNYYEDFELGQRLHHHWGRTLTESDAINFSTLTLNFNPLYFNEEYARSRGHAGLVANPMLVLLTAIGLSVQDLSESGGAFLGIDNVVFHRPVLVGETIVASSEVIDKRESKSRPHNGIVSWRTTIYSGGEAVVTAERTNLVSRRDVNA